MCQPEGGYSRHRGYRKESMNRRGPSSRTVRRKAASCSGDYLGCSKGQQQCTGKHTAGAGWGAAAQSRYSGSGEGTGAGVCSESGCTVSGLSRAGQGLGAGRAGLQKSAERPEAQNVHVVRVVHVVARQPTSWSLALLVGCSEAALARSSYSRKAVSVSKPPTTAATGRIKGRFRLED